LATLADPKNYQGYYARAAAVWALAQEAKEQGEDAQFEEYANAILADLDKLVEIGTDDQEELIAVYQTKGDVLYMLGRLDDAQAAYTKAVQLSPENYSLMLTMANRFYNEQDWQNAANYYQEALGVKTRLNLIDEKDAENYAALGNALSLQDRRPEAIECFKKVLELKPNDTAALYNMMVTHYKTGEASEKSGDTATAKQHYNQAIELGNQLIGIDPKNPQYWQVRGFSKRGIGDTAGAARDLTEYKNLRSAGGQ
jgi:tetratricopeptide (TPR) repeat protein